MHHISSHCLAMEILSQNISKTLSWILLKLYELRGSYIGGKGSREQFLVKKVPVPNNTAASIIANGVISLL